MTTALAQRAPLIEMVPPHSLDAEQGVLGSCLLAGKALTLASEQLDTGDFYRGAHRDGWLAMMALKGRQEGADTLTVGEELRRMDRLDSVGGQDYLFSLVNSVPTAAHVDYYAGIVREHSALRQLIETADTLTHNAYAGDLRSEELGEVASKRIVAIIRERGVAGSVSAMQAWEGVKQDLSDTQMGLKPSGWATGLPMLDANLDLLPGRLFVVSGRPKTGKTLLMQQIARRLVSVEKLPGVFFSLEMGTAELMGRELQHATGINSRRILSGKLTDDEEAQVNRAGLKIGEWPLTYVDAAFRFSEIEARTQDAVERHGARWIVLDGLGQIRVAGNNESRALELERLAYACKELAKRYGVVVITAIHLNRQGDVRGSDGPEQACDALVTVEGDDSDLNSDAERSPRRVCIKHNRHGGKGNAEMILNTKWLRFEEQAFAAQEQAAPHWQDR